LRAMGEHGHGTIVPLANGRFRIAVTMADGRRVWRRARTERQAERIRAQLVEARELDLDPTRQTLAGWLRSWIQSLRDAKRQRLAPRTLEHYAMIVELHIIPGLDPKGTLPLTKVTAARIQAWLDRSEGAARTIHHHRAVLRLALNRAVRQRILVYNPAAGKSLELPDARWRGAKPLTVDEARKLLAAAEPRWLPLWRLALVTGLRFGELMGLTWDDVEDDAVVVRAQLQRIAGEWVRRPTKSARLVERISIDRTTVALLEAHRARLAAERQPGWRYFGHVFVDERGEPYHHRRVLVAFHAACEAAGIGRRRLHDLRHGNNEILKELAVPRDVRMARHGHSTTEMDTRYGRASPAQDREAAEKLAEAIG
jgi:integrase